VPNMREGETPVDFHSCRMEKPDKHEFVLVRGYGEARKHYLYEFAKWEVTTAGARWENKDGEELWFEPIQWARLPQPELLEV
jgi:hypothetical protein